MSFGIIFLVCLAVASGVIYWQISRSGGVDVKKVAAAAGLTMALCIFFNLGTTPAPAPKPTTAPAPAPQTAPKSEPTTAPPPAPKPSPQPAPQPEPSLTVEEFDQRLLSNLNLFAVAAGIDPAESMGTPEHRGNNIIYRISTTARLEENVTASGGLRGINIVTEDLNQGTIKSALIFFECAVIAFEPETDYDAVTRALALTSDSPDIRKNKLVTINGITYIKTLTDQSLILGVKR